MGSCHSPANSPSFSLAQVGEEQFPADYQLSNYQKDELLRTYLSIDVARRRFDFYLYDFSDADNPKDYWTSEGRSRQRTRPLQVQLHYSP